ncbi:KTSC domain-containing protein [Nostoc sp.]|uniref:KTSC domain-containing protein n=1 Tax=Nostoc sp. TaxID=1180 RepID=UPI0030307B12
MQITSVLSSNIASIGYDAKQQILEVEFLKGSVYQYSGVSESLYTGLMSADSHGNYLDIYIKKGNFAYRHIQ